MRFLQDAAEQSQTTVLVAVTIVLVVIAAIIVCYCWYRCMYSKNNTGPSRVKKSSASISKRNPGTNQNTFHNHYLGDTVTDLVDVSQNWHSTNYMVT